MGMKKILIIEKERSLAGYIEAGLMLSTVDVQSAHDVMACQLSFARESYFLVVLDLRFSTEELEKITAYINEKNIPTIIMQDENLPIQCHVKRALVVDMIPSTAPDSVVYLLKTVKRISENRYTKVLVAEDSPSDRQMLVSLVSQQLYQVYEARDGKEAMAMLEENPDIKIIVTDIHMPEMDGVKLLKYVRERKMQNELAVLGISSNHESLIQFLKLGGNDFVNKPFKKEEFVARLNNLVSVYQHIRELDELSKRDFLTRLYSRKYFFEKAAPYIFSAYHDKRDFAIGMIDIDDFKNINDSYGHEVGDKVIRSVARVLHDGLKGSDIVARYGGEEFCVLLKETSREDARIVFENLRKKIASTLVHKIALPHGHDIYFTVSIGVCTKAEPSLDVMLDHADALLYEAKRLGKNQVVSTPYFEPQKLV